MQFAFENQQEKDRAQAVLQETIDKLKRVQASLPTVRNLKAIERQMAHSKYDEDIAALRQLRVMVDLTPIKTH